MTNNFCESSCNLRKKLIFQSYQPNYPVVNIIAIDSNIRLVDINVLRFVKAGVTDKAQGNVISSSKQHIKLSCFLAYSPVFAE